MTNSGSLIKFQIGPVQEFIAQARSTRDLWSGSYLLSWLVAAGIRKAGYILGDLTGKDPYEAAKEAFIYPALEGQPLTELRFGRSATKQENLGLVETCDLLTPNLPNIFVLRMDADPADAAVQAREIENEIRSEWKRIATECWKKCSGEGIVSADLGAGFQRQIDRFLSVSWQVTPMDTCYARSYKTLSSHLDAVRQTRDFRAWREGRWHRDDDTLTEKDTLTGKEEALIGGLEWFKNTKVATDHWNDEKQMRRSLWNILLREKHAGDYLGATTLIKRTWHWHFLHAIWGIRCLHTKEPSARRTQFPFPSTRHIAVHKPWSNLDDESDEQEGKHDRLDSYFAVLAFDGDHAGKWIGGAFCDPDEKWHRDFSQRLSTYALKCVRPIVDACDGRLIYAGGDDVIALLPPDTALDCARFLRMAYRGDFSFLPKIRDLAGSLILRTPSPFDEDEGKTLREADFSPHRQNAKNGAGIFVEPPILDATALPGGVTGRIRNPDTGKDSPINPDASVGIAIAHFKNPLQDVVRAAQSAEKRAKRKLSEGGLGRAAVSVSLLKRSGEHIDWGCKWESRGIELYDHLASAIQSRSLSSRFPYRLCQLLSAYQSVTLKDHPNFDARAVIEAEFAHVLKQQATSSMTTATRGTIQAALETFLDSLSSLAGTGEEDLPRKDHTQFLLTSVTGLCQTLAFTIRDRDPSDEAAPAEPHLASA